MKTRDEQMFSRALRWLGNQDSMQHTWDVDEVCSILCQFQKPDVNFKQWRGTMLPDYVQNRNDATTKRILLQGPAGYA